MHPGEHSIMEEHPYSPTPQAGYHTHADYKDYALIDVKGEPDQDIVTGWVQVGKPGTTESVDLKGNKLLSFETAWETSGNGGMLGIHNSKIDAQPVEWFGPPSTNHWDYAYGGLKTWQVTIYDAETNAAIGTVDMNSLALANLDGYKYQDGCSTPEEYHEMHFNPLCLCQLHEMVDSAGSYYTAQNAYYHFTSDQYTGIRCWHGGHPFWVDGDDQEHGEADIRIEAGRVVFELPDGVNYVYMRFEFRQENIGGFNYAIPKYFKVGSDKFTVTLEGDDGIESLTGAGEYSGGSEVTISAALKPGYVFKGWETTTTGYSNSASNPYTFTGNRDVTYKAVTESQSYTLNFNYNKPSTASSTMVGNSITSKTVTYGNSIGNLPNPSLKGWKFERWTLKNLEITKDTVWSYTEDNLTAYAQWTPKTYTLNFDYNKPSTASSTMVGNDTASKSVTYDSAVGDLPNPSMTGWIFNGWVLKGAGLTKDTIWRYDEERLTAVASWTPKTYTLNFDYNKPSNASNALTGNSTTSKTVTYDSAIGDLPDPGIIGWKFEGWLLKGVIITTDTIWRYDEDRLTTTASWTPNDYTLIYDDGDTIQ